MKKDLETLLKSLGFVIVKKASYTIYYHNENKNDIIVLVKGRLRKCHYVYVRKHLDMKGYCGEKDFNKQFKKVL